jgi:hypothetical protein
VDPAGVDVRQLAYVLDDGFRVVRVGGGVGRRRVGEGGEIHRPVIGDDDRIALLQEALEHRSAVVAPGPAGQLLHAPPTGRPMEVHQHRKRPVALRLPHRRGNVYAVLALDVDPLDRRIGLAHDVDVLVVREGLAARELLDVTGHEERQQEPHGRGL